MTIGRGDIRRMAPWPEGLTTRKDAQSSATGAKNSMERMNFRLLALMFLLAVLDPITVESSESLNSHNVSGILDGLLVGYDKRVRPNFGGTPVEVGISMYVLNLGSISEAEMDFTLDFYFRQHWTDPRLTFPSSVGLESISVGPEYGKNIWFPDTFFVNEKQSYFHSPPSSNEFIRIKSSGDIIRSVRITVTASCPMNLQYFPMDNQLCAIEIESYGHSSKDIRYKWMDGQAIGISYDISLPQFKIVGYRQKAIDISLLSGNYSRLACEIQFVRSVGYYILQIYVPSALIVAMSWVTFWLNRNVASTRIGLGVIILLTMTALMSSTNTYLPKVSYVKATDVYLGFCFIMIFVAQLEYATVCYMLKTLQTRKNRYHAIQKLADEKKQGHDKSGADGASTGLKQTEVRFKVFDSKVVTSDNGMGSGKVDEEGGILSGGKADKLFGVSPSDLDKYSRILFPSTFICFNLMYWIIYINITDVVASDLMVMGQDG